MTIQAFSPVPVTSTIVPPHKSLAQLNRCAHQGAPQRPASTSLCMRAQSHKVQPPQADLAALDCVIPLTKEDTATIRQAAHDNQPVSITYTNPESHHLEIETLTADEARLLTLELGKRPPPSSVTQAKTGLIKHILSQKPAEHLLNIAMRSPQGPARDNIIRLIGEHTLLEYEKRKTPLVEASILHQFEPNSEQQHTRSIIQTRLEQKMAGAHYNPVYRLNPPELQIFMAKAKGVYPQLPRVDGVHLQRPRRGALRVKRIGDSPLDLAGIRNMLKTLAPSIVLEQHTQAQICLTRIKNLNNNDIRSLEEITAHELKGFLKSVLLNETHVKELILTVDSAHQQLHKLGARQSPTPLSIDEKAKCGLHIQQYIASQLHLHFEKMLKKQQVPIVVQATPCALAVIHDTFLAMSNGSATRPNSLLATTHNSLLAIIDQQCERWIYNTQTSKFE